MIRTNRNFCATRSRRRRHSRALQQLSIAARDLAFERLEERALLKSEFSASEIQDLIRDKVATNSLVGDFANSA
jgi:hypothetical protein